ncbi:MAG: TonB family protein [Candidatus Zixiibacteriota bacterium]
MKNVNVNVAGTVHLKRSYQRNFLIAEIFLIVVMGLAIGICAIVLAGEQAPDKGPIVVVDRSDLQPPPIHKRPVVEVDKPEPPKPPDWGLVEAVDDTAVVFEYTIASREDLASYNGSQDSGIGVGTYYVEPSANIEEIIPAPDSFIAFDEAPKAIDFPPAKYPEIARKAQIEGSVWIKVFVDANGTVLDVVAAKAPGTNAGFEEAAIAAARESKWRPAMQNKQPIAVWVTYEVRFKLK